MDINFRASSFDLASRIIQSGNFFIIQTGWLLFYSTVIMIFVLVVVLCSPPPLSSTRKRTEEKEQVVCVWLHETEPVSHHQDLVLRARAVGGYK